MKLDLYKLLHYFIMQQVAAIAAVCIQPEADYRPFMTDIVQSLIPLVLKTPGASLPNTPSRNYEAF
jgi:hypothetical protein